MLSCFWGGAHMIIGTRTCPNAGARQCFAVRICCSIAAMVRTMKWGSGTRKLRLPAVLALLLFLLLFACLLPQLSPVVVWRKPVIPLVGANSVEGLVGALRSATAVALRYRNVSFTDQDAQAWRRSNPCASRTELGPRYARRPHAKLLDANPQWELVLEEYTALHRTCIRSMGNIKDYYNSQGASSSPCKFLIMEISGVGVGNKISLLISGMLYAIMTQRVILLNTWSYIPWTMCEPFLGSSWVNDDHFPLPQRHGPESTLLGRFAGWEAPVWKSSTYFARGIDAILAGESDASLPSKVKVEFSDPEVKRFFCNTEQAFLSEATWIHFTGCLYFLPKLFAVPAFRPALEALFPDPSLTLTYLLRSLMLPNDAVWQQVKHHDQELFAGVDRRVGIQVRFLYGRKVYFERSSKRANKHVKQCVIENNILPRPDSTSLSGVGESTTRVLVTSLHKALADDLRGMYESSTVKVSQLTHGEKQRFGTDDDHKAMVEILLLSFVDELLVTPLSTFGGLAQAYGAIVPWFVEVKRNGRSGGSCVRAQTVDLCYQTANWWYDCPHEPSLHRRNIPEVVPYLRRCLPIEESDGLQLVSPGAFV